ncbi:MAG: hypothetical protein D6710_10445 [Nitrospirae bacterium]|nr:MAG: hypothetical protein D6710_10445 [Nitrospirota bacterium]
MASSVVHKWLGAVHHRGKVWMCPYYETSVLVVDPERYLVGKVAVGSYGGAGYYAGTDLVGDKVVCTPYNSPHVLVLDTVTNGTSVVATGVGGSAKWIFGAVVGRKVYMCPGGSGVVGVYDGDGHSFTTVGSGIPKHHGCVAVGTRLVMPPRFSTIGVFDTVTNKYWTVAIPGPSGFFDDPCVYGTRVYMFPYTETEKSVLVYDSVTGVVGRVASVMSGRGPCIAYAGGYLVGAPMSSDQKVYIFDTHTNTTKEIISNIGYTSDNPTYYSYRGGVAVGNKVVVTPSTAKEVLVIELQL